MSQSYLYGIFYADISQTFIEHWQSIKRCLSHSLCEVPVNRKQQLLHGCLKLVLLPHTHFFIDFEKSQNDSGPVLSIPMDWSCLTVVKILTIRVFYAWAHLTLFYVLFILYKTLK